MNTIKKISILFIAFTMMMVACRKDEVNMDTQIIPTPPQISVISSLVGQVVDESGIALEDVSITLNNNTYTTDENGFFKFDDVAMNEYGTYVKAEKAGYFLGAKMIEPHLNARSFTKIRLIEKSLTGTVESASGGTISTSDNASVTLPSNGIKVEGGSDYTGSVNVYAKWLNPTDANILETMPGDLRASDLEGEFVQLATYGMIAVELESPSGEALNIADGQTATIELPVPNELLNDAPTTIPLWHFDEATGYWIEDGTATLQGDKYVGEVSHFSFWNCDAPFPLVQVSGNVEDDSGNNLSYFGIKITVNSTGICGFGYVDSEGNFSGKMPKNEELTIEVIDYCGNVIYSETIGPFTDDTILPTITVTSTANLFQFSGTLIDCNDNVVTNGYVLVNIDNYQYFVVADENGNVMSTISNCNGVSNLNFTAYDLDNIKSSQPETHDITGLSSYDAGNIDICEDIVEYLNFTFDGGATTTIISPSATVSPDGMIIQGFSPDSLGVKFIIFEENTTGTYTPDGMEVLGQDQNGDYIWVSCDLPGCGTAEVTITSIGTTGDALEGTYFGEVAAPNGNVAPFNGDFKIIID